MKTNITLKIDADLLREVKALAARQGTSVSRLVADQLEQLIRHEKAYDKAKHRALARLRQGFDLEWAPPTSREELYER